MAKKTKDELIEEAQNLGLDVDPEDNYSDIFDLVKMAREDEEPLTPKPADPEPEPEVVEDDPTQEPPEDDGGDDEEEPERSTSSWPFNEYGVYTGRRRFS